MRDSKVPYSLTAGNAPSCARPPHPGVESGRTKRPRRSWRLVNQTPPQRMNARLAGSQTIPAKWVASLTHFDAPHWAHGALRAPYGHLLWLANNFTLEKCCQWREAQPVALALPTYVTPYYSLPR
ncbi:hypothetical protein ACW9KT_19325 [Hymenobacter sp. HD11105]